MDKYEKHKISAKKYYDKNRELLLEKKKERIQCPLCMNLYQKSYFKLHRCNKTSI